MKYFYYLQFNQYQPFTIYVNKCKDIIPHSSLYLNNTFEAFINHLVQHSSNFVKYFLLPQSLNITS